MQDGLSLSRGVSLLCALPQFLLPTVTCSHCLPVVGRSIEAFKLHCLQVYDRARKRETVCAFTFVSLRSSTLNTQSRHWQLFLLLFPFSTCLPMHTHIHTRTQHVCICIELSIGYFACRDTLRFICFSRAQFISLPHTLWPADVLLNKTHECFTKW